MEERRERFGFSFRGRANEPRQVLQQAIIPGSLLLLLLTRQSKTQQHKPMICICTQVFQLRNSDRHSKMAYLYSKMGGHSWEAKQPKVT
jgi:hypothetical protein